MDDAEYEAYAERRERYTHMVSTFKGDPSEDVVEVNYKTVAVMAEQPIETELVIQCNGKETLVFAQEGDRMVLKSLAEDMATLTFGFMYVHRLAVV